MSGLNAASLMFDLIHLVSFSTSAILDTSPANTGSAHSRQVSNKVHSRERHNKISKRGIQIYLTPVGRPPDQVCRVTDQPET